MRKYSYENERIEGLAKVVKMSALLLFASIAILGLMLRSLLTLHLLLIFLLLIVAGVSFTMAGLGLVRELKAKEEQVVAAELKADKAEQRAKEAERKTQEASQSAAEAEAVEEKQ